MKKIDNDVDCVLMHPHKGKCLSRKTIDKRIKDKRWADKCVLCGKERVKTKDFDLLVCASCFFDLDFSLASKKERKR